MLYVWFVLTLIGLVLVKEAASAGAKLLCFPEGFSFIGANDEDSVKIAEPLDGPIMQQYRSLARWWMAWMLCCLNMWTPVSIWSRTLSSCFFVVTFLFRLAHRVTDSIFSSFFFVFLSAFTWFSTEGSRKSGCHLEDSKKKGQKRRISATHMLWLMMLVTLGALIGRYTCMVINFNTLKYNTRW